MNSITAFEGITRRHNARSFMDRLDVLDIKGDKWDYTLSPKSLRKICMPCSPGHYWSPERGLQPISRCRRWDCDDCGPIRKMEFVDLVQSNRDWYTDGSFYMLTATFRAQDGSIISARESGINAESANKYAQRLAILASKVLPLATGTTKSARSPYIKVKEFTKQGIPHYHIVLFNVQRGLSEQYRRVYFKYFREAWRKITGGSSYVIDFRKGYKSPAQYLAKYLTKSLPEGYTGRRFSTSRHFFRVPRVKPLYQLLYRFSEDSRKSTDDVSRRTPREWAFGYAPGRDPGLFRHEPGNHHRGVEYHTTETSHREYDQYFDLLPRRYHDIPHDTLRNLILARYGNTESVKRGFARSWALMLQFKDVLKHRELDHARSMECRDSSTGNVPSPVQFSLDTL